MPEKNFPVVGKYIFNAKPIISGLYIFSNFSIVYILVIVYSYLEFKIKLLITLCLSVSSACIVCILHEIWESRSKSPDPWNWSCTQLSAAMKVWKMKLGLISEYS